MPWLPDGWCAVAVEPEPDLPQQLASFRSGTIKVGAGLAASGAANYVFASIATRAMGPVGFAEFNIFWGLVFGIGLGVFYPFEQEVSRRVSQAQSAGLSSRAARATAYRLAAVTAVALAAVAYPLARVLTNGRHVLPLWATTSAAFAGLAVAYVSRGGLSGRTMFGRYGGQLGVEAAVRLALAVVLLVLGVTSPWPFAGIVAVGLLVAVLATVPRRGSGAPGEPLATATLAASVGTIVVSSTIAQSLINLGPVAVNWLSAASERAQAGSFLAAALIARMPVFAFAAVQAVLIPRLVRAVAQQRRTDFARSLRMVLAATLALGLAGVALCALAGPQLLHLLAGSEYALSRTDMAMLAVAVAFYLLAMVLQPAALSLTQHRATMVPWLACAAVFPVVLLVPLSPVRAVGTALIVSAAVAVAGLALVVRRGWALHL